MRRRLPVIQPTALERRAFLLGLFGAGVAACTSDAAPAAHRGSSSGNTSSGSSGEGSSGSSGTSGTTNPPEPPGSDGGGSSSGGTDSGTEAGPTKTCATGGGVDVGAPASFAAGTLTFVSTVPAFVGRDANGLYAMYPLCTHSVGNLVQSSGQLTCTVHGARFSLVGDVLQGPATMPLPHYDVCLNAKGNVAVDPDIVVSAATRLKA